MDRVPYRRVSQKNYQKNCQEEPNLAETLIIQCIISGILLAVILLIGLVDLQPTETLRYGVKEILSGATTFEELSYEVRTLSETWLGQESPTPLTAVEGEPSNPYIPGPSVTPGLWD